jgi:hypothetical protein
MPIDSGTIDKTINATETVPRRFNRFLDILSSRDVGDERDGAFAVVGKRRFLRGVRRDGINQGDPPSPVEEKSCRRKANAS